MPKVQPFNKLTKLSKQRLIRFLLIALIGIVGISTLIFTQAATYSISTEPEAGALSGNATKISGDSTASGQSFVQFGGASNPSNNLLDNFFLIGTFKQPEDSFAKWKSRGVNTILDPPGGYYPSDEDGGSIAKYNNWVKEADKIGLKVMGAPEAGTDVAASKSNVIAWTHFDEPEQVNQFQVPYTKIQSDYNLWKSINPNMPAFINFVGYFQAFDMKTGEGGPDWYKKYIAGADWISGDTYPAMQDDPISVIGDMLDTFKDLAPNKPRFAYIETPDMFWADSRPGPTPGQLRAEIWSAIVHGARGYMFFSHAFNVDGGWAGYDYTPNNVAAEMTIQNNKVTSLTSVLQGPINPDNLNATVNKPLEVGWRNHSSGKYFIVVNLEGNQLNNQQITLSGIGSATSAEVYQEGRSKTISGNKITDNFEPFGVHIYKIN